VGEREGGEVGVDLSTTGLVLAGASAADVVRAAVTGLLAGQGPSTMAAVVAGDLLPAVPPFPGLAQTAAIAPALDELTSEVARRVQLLADDGVSDAGAYRAKHPDANFPMIVLAAADVGAADLERVRALFADGARAGVSGIVVGAATAEGDDSAPPDVVLAPGAMVVEVRPEALAEPLLGARLFRMEPLVAAELLAVLASARTDGEHMRPGADDDESFVPATSAATAPVAVQLLGVYRIEVDGTEIKSGLRAKAKELLAFYLLHPEGATLDDAVEALWPEADPRRGSEWFWTALGNLRTKLRQATGQKELKVIDRDGDLYRIEDVFDVDLWSLQHALREGAQSRDDAVRQSALDRAVADYDGELLTGLDWFWLETPREDLRQRMVDVLVWLGDRRWASGDARAAWAALQRALEVDPFAEQIYRRIMRLQGKLSRPDDADVTYRRLVAKLQEVDLQPTPETDKLHAEVCPQP
jgi:DNA-binding SARP family transcriptional activator